MKHRQDEELIGALQLNTLSVDYLKNTAGPDQHSRVEVRMHQMRAEEGQLHVQEMNVPLGHLQKFLEEGERLLEKATVGPRDMHWDSPDRVESLSDYKASYFVHTGKGGKNRVDVHLEGEERDNAEVRKSEMSCGLNRLKEVVEKGCEVEKEQGIKREYYAIVTPTELTGPIEAKATVHSCRTDQAQGLIDAHTSSNPRIKPQEYVLWPVPLGWEPKPGDTITVRANVDAHIDKYFGKLEADSRRMGEFHAYGVWHDEKRQPHIGETISWNPESRGLDSRGEVVDYQVTPALGTKTPGIPADTTYVVFNKDTRTVVALCDSPEEATQAVRDADKLERERKPQEQQRQRDQNIDLSQHSIGRNY